MKATDAVVIIHSQTDVLGSLADLLPELGINFKVIPVTENLPEPKDINLLFVMGSPESAYDHRLPWLPKELKWLQMTQQHAIPTFGICFGSQLLARALGGQVYKNSEPEIGWTTMKLLDTSWQHAGPWLNFHFDAFTVPNDATLLAETELAQQAYKKNKAMGVQFHPEIDTAMFDTWLDYWKNTKDGQRFLAKVGDLPERMRIEIAEKEQINRHNCKQLITDFLNNI